MTLRKSIGKAFYRMGDALALGYDAGESNKVRRDLGWSRSTPIDEDSLVSDRTRELIRLKASDLRRNNAIVAGIGERFAQFTVSTGIIPQARTSSKQWNKQAEDFWHEWSKICDIRRRATLWRLQWQAVSLRPIQGGMYIELLDNGQIRPIECERIRQPNKPDEAKAFTDGVKVHKDTGITLGYKVHSRDNQGQFSAKSTETYIEAENIIPVLTPPWRLDQVREIPDLAPIIPALQDIHEMNAATLATAKAQSHFVGVLKKIVGQGLNALPRGTVAAGPASRQNFKLDGLQILEAFPGEDLDMKVSPTPNAQHIPYIKMQLLLAAAALDVPYEFLTLDFSSADFSRMKAILLMVNRKIRCWQKWVADDMLQRLWNWRIAKAIKNGELPAAPTEDRNGLAISQWYKVDWQAPEEPWLDRQEANQADMLEWQMGLTPISIAVKRRGRDLEETLREKAANMKLAAEIEKENDLPEGSLIKAQIPGQTEPGATAKTEKKPDMPMQDDEDMDAKKKGNPDEQ